MRSQQVNSTHFHNMSMCAHRYRDLADMYVQCNAQDELRPFPDICITFFFVSRVIGTILGIRSRIA